MIRRIQRLTMNCHGRLDIMGEVLIDRRRGFFRQQGDALLDGASRRSRRLDHSHRMQKHLEQPEVQERVENEKEELAKIYRAQARRILDSINDKDIEKASLQQKAFPPEFSWINHCSSQETCHLSASRFFWPQ